jgi:hypothetical protein
MALEKANFPVLHNIAKDAIYLEENLDALLHMVQRMKECHEKHAMKCSCDIIMNNHRNIEYRRTVIDSSRLQVNSLHKRALNLIQLVSNTQNWDKI